MNPACGSLKSDLLERVYIPKGPPILTLTKWKPDAILTSGKCLKGPERSSKRLRVFFWGGLGFRAYKVLKYLQQCHTPGTQKAFCILYRLVFGGCT